MPDTRPGKPLIVPIFIPNQGCPYQCIYCQQEKITGRPAQPLKRSSLEQILDEAIRSSRFDVHRAPEVAFYGGTFTRLPAQRMMELLETVAKYLERGYFRSIRASTRPDAIHEKQLHMMKGYGISTVELGTQSMDDDVLALSQRGHRAEDTTESVHLLKRLGVKVGIQLMPGLPGDSEEKFKETVQKVIDLRPHMVRLYPTIVIRGTELARWYHEGRYRPLELHEAVRFCKEACIRLEEEGIPVIRMGLMSSPSLLREGEIVAGPWHPAFGFLVRASIHQDRIRTYLPTPGQVRRIRIRAPFREIPLVRGYKNLGLQWVEGQTGARVLGVVSDASVPPGQVGVDVYP